MGGPNEKGAGSLGEKGEGTEGAAREKAKRRTWKIKMYIRDRSEEERDEEFKNQSNLSFFCFPAVHLMSYSPNVGFFFCLNSPPTQVIFSFSIFFFLFFFLLSLLFCFSVCNNISLREKRKKKYLQCCRNNENRRDESTVK